MFFDRTTNPAVTLLYERARAGCTGFEVIDENTPPLCIMGLSEFEYHNFPDEEEWRFQWYDQCTGQETKPTQDQSVLFTNDFLHLFRQDSRGVRKARIVWGELPGTPAEFARVIIRK